MRPSSLEEDKTNKDAAEQQRRRCLDLNQVNVNDRNNQSSLLYEALFLPDKTSHSGGTKCNYATSVNNSVINTGFVSPHAKGTPVFVNNADRWKSTRSLSSSTESLSVNADNSLSQSSDSLRWNSSSTSPASGSKSHLQHCSSTETVGSYLNEVDGQNKEHLCEVGGHGFTRNMQYNDVSGASASSSAFQILNNQCYEAAISEGMTIFPGNKYTAKMKHSKNLTVGCTDGPTQMRQRQTDKSCYHRHRHRHNRIGTLNEKVSELTKTKCSSDFLAPSAPSLLSMTRSESPKSSPSGGPFNVTEHKKYRYNQTFSALQQSGLMKTTMKTAELLRRSRSLQQELAKLRRDTTLFVECVLNNPQNRDLKEQCERNKNSGGSKTAIQSSKQIS